MFMSSITQFFFTVSAISGDIDLLSSAVLSFTLVATLGAAFSPKLIHVGTAIFHGFLPPRRSGRM